MVWGLAAVLGGGLLVACGLTCHSLVAAVQGKWEKSTNCSTFGDIAAVLGTGWLVKILGAGALAKLLGGGKAAAPAEGGAPSEPAAPAEPTPTFPGPGGFEPVIP